MATEQERDHRRQLAMAVAMAEGRREKKMVITSRQLDQALDQQLTAVVKSLLVFVVLALAWFLGFSSRLFSVIRFESIIHEFDPWYVQAVAQCAAGKMPFS